VRLDAEPIAFDQLPPEVKIAIFDIVPVGFSVSYVVKSNFTGDKNANDYLVFQETAATNVYGRYRLSIVRWNPTMADLRVIPIVSAAQLSRPDIRPDDLIIYKSWGGTIYAKTIGYEHSDCWETIVFWNSEKSVFVAEVVLFNTSDGFNYPVGPKYPVDIQTGDFPGGWRIDQAFQDCKNYPANEPPCSHLGEDWNDKNGGNSDLGHPVFAVSLGEVIFAGDGGPGWNGIVVLRHRPPIGEDVFSFYGHLNVSSDTKRKIRPISRGGIDQGEVRTLSDVLHQSTPGRLAQVEKGQLVGYIGPGPEGEMSHLHFEMIVEPAIAYNPHEWKGYRPLDGSEAQWKNPSKFIEENRSYWNGFGVGEDRLGTGVAPVALENCYKQNGGLHILGQPIGVLFHNQSSSSGTASASQAFQNGEIYYHQDGPLAGKAFAILNPLLARFRMLAPARTPGDLAEEWGYNPTDVSGSPLGLPVEDIAAEVEISHYSTKFRFQNFENGALEFHQAGLYAGEVFEIHGAIFNRWSSSELNYAAGPLGLPIGDEKEAEKSPLSGRTGRFSAFEGGVIHWVREENKTYVIGLNPNIGRQSNIAKLIADRYMKEGGSGGNLGFPASDDYLWQGGVRCDFEGGYISWTPSEGLKVINSR
jgi:murein DD-endopeptidase MepM/ murein hydrolase activator NlpD